MSRIQAAPPQFSLPPLRKRHPVRNGFLVLAPLLALGIGGWVASVSNEGAKSTAATGLERSYARDVTVGEAFTVGKHQTLAGWTVKRNELGMFSIDGKVKNVGDTASTAFFAVQFLSAEGQVLGDVSCSSPELEPGRTRALDCVPDGTFGKYARVTAEATF